MCGEKLCINLRRCFCLGSPPHVRGKPSFSRPAFAEHWITPACAGKSTHSLNIDRSRRDHPRMCGEKNIDFYFAFVLVGITPACAGKSDVLLCEAVLLQDHPRMCGEKKTGGDAAPRIRGSPPHVRGKGCLTDVGGQWNRITPACAGKSIAFRIKPF